MRIVYWSTACPEHAFEAVAKEQAALAERFRPSWTVAVNTHARVRLSRRGRYASFPPRYYQLARPFVRLIERCGDLNHVYGEATPWHFLERLGRRPIVHTMVQHAQSFDVGRLERCSAVVAQTTAARDAILATGYPEERVRLWYPGVDIDRFAPASRPPGEHPRILFATAPREEHELGPRGVHLLLDCAREHSDARFRLLYRPWTTRYTSLAPTESRIRELDLDNVELTNEAVADMATIYGEYDFTVIPFTRPDGGKECPNSAVESLCCGVPVLVSSASPFAQFVASHDCGEVFDPAPTSFGAALERALGRRDELARAARSVAEKELSESALFARYAELYDEVLERTAVPIATG